MHIEALLTFLRASHGEPEQLKNQQAYRWRIQRRHRADIHLVLSYDESTRRVSIWLFDPGNSAEPAQYFYVNNADQLNDVVGLLSERLANGSVRSH